ncbi:MAG: putative porin [Candidatus Acidiferrales bacterium]
MNPPVWLEKLAAVYHWLRPDAERRRRTRYFIFDLIGRVAKAEADAAAGKQEERPMTVPLKKGTLAVLMALLLAAPMLAGENDSKTTPPAASQQPLQQQLTEQQQRILELERLLKQQGLLLEALRQQLASMQPQPAPMPSSASAGAPAVQEPPVTQEIDRISGELDAVAESNKELNQKVNEMEKKNAASEKSLGDKIKGLGNFTFSGDVRVRYEPFFGGTQTQDRHRERFRARFNANAKFSDEISGGLSIASGELTDPISTNQTLTQFFERKTIAIDRAFIAYNPKWYKPLTLTGGKFGYTWYRTEQTFDSDLNPEGFSQAFSWKINNPVLQRITLVGAELPFNEVGSSNDSFLYVAQVGSFWKFGDRIRLTGYAGFYNWHLADPVRQAQVAGTLTGSSNSNTTAPGNLYASKFAILNLIGRVDIDTGKSRWPLMLQLDFTNNTRPCTNIFVATCNPRDRSGWWGEVQVGKTAEKGDINFGYTFIRIEREAVLAAFNFSDLRQPTNVVTHRFNFGYQAFKNITLAYTLLVGRQLQTATSPTEEPWLKRMQFDVFYKF